MGFLIRVLKMVISVGFISRLGWSVVSESFSLLSFLRDMSLAASILGTERKKGPRVLLFII